MKYLIEKVEKISGDLSINVGKNFLLNTIPGLLLLDGEIEIKNYIETLPSHYQYLKKTIYNES